MQVDYLIIGQGISGTWLSYFLDKETCTYLVIDNDDQTAASRLAAGVINPVTGRRHVEVWLADEVLPYAWQMYSAMSTELEISAISKNTLLDMFPSAQMRLSFQQRVGENDKYVSLNESNGDLRNEFHYEFGYGEIEPVYTVQLAELLPTWRKILKDKSVLKKEEFDINDLEVFSDHIKYQDIIASKIIFCDGARSASYPFFKNLPFAPNKGEALLLQINDLSKELVYKKGMMLAHWSDNKWWLGSNYAWEFTDANPTIQFRETAEQLLRSWLKVPYEVLEHLAGVRPATLERRPFVGIHPYHSTVAILNGMGTKGCSLAPFFAKQLVGELLQGEQIYPEADIKRFTKVLGRS